MIIHGCYTPYGDLIYTQTWTRMSPYGFGMYAAYIHLKDDDHSFFSRSSIILEWLCFIVFAFLVPLNTVFVANFGIPILNVIWICTSKQLYGLSISYLLTIILSPKPDDSIPCYRPSKFLRWILSWSMWVPVASLSYSFYLWHLQPIVIMQGLNLKLFTPPKIYNSTACEQGLGNVLWNWTKNYLFIFTLTTIVSVLSFTFLEKPGIDARVIYKNKYAK